LNSTDKTAATARQTSEAVVIRATHTVTPPAKILALAALDKLAAPLADTATTATVQAQLVVAPVA